MKLIDKIRTDIRAALDERAAADAEVKAIVAGAEARGEDLTAEEADRFTVARAKVADIDVRVAGLNERLDVLKADEEARAAAERVAAEVGRFEPQLRGGRAERTYRPDADPRGRQFLRDVAAGAMFGDWEAQQRLARHMTEERVERGASFESRAAGTGAFSVQLAAYNTRREADEAVARLTRRGLDVRVDGDVKPFRVRSGRYTTRAQAAAALAELKTKGFSGFIAELTP